MPDALQPLRFLLLVFAGLVTRDQVRAIEFLREENRVLRERLGGRVRLDDDQRRRLAAKGAPLGRRMLASIATIVTPDTLLRWHRTLIAAKHTHAVKTKRIGRPGLMKSIREHIVRMAKDNARWGYARIQGEMQKLGHTVARTTIANTLKDHGVPLSPERPTSWRTFLKAHSGAIAATDFFTAEVWTARGLVTHYVFFRDPPRDQARRDRRRHRQPRWCVHGAGRAQPDRPRGGRPSGSALPDPRPRHQVHRAVPAHPRGRQCAGGPDGIPGRT